MSVTRKLLTAAAAVLLISGAACASKPKPGPDMGGPGNTGGPGGPGGVDGGPMEAIPGSEQDFIVNVGDRVYFDYDQYDIRADARPILDSQARWLNQYRSVRVRISTNALKTVDHRGGLDAFLLKAKDTELAPKMVELKRQIRKKQAAAS